MEIYECILSLIAGVGVFILAMKLLSDSLNEIAGERMKTLLEKIAGNRIKGVLVGALVTGVIQSSSATTVMVIGFVNANVMDLNQAAAIIIGANIGTTVTGLLASLESLNISLYLSLLTFIGVMLAFVKSIKKIANLLVGLGMIFVGLKLMSDSCNDKSIKSSFEDVLKKISFPLLLELLGVIFTAIIQSSSAMTGIVIVMVQNKVMDMHNGLFITLGANVGTCVTAIIGIIGANINSKRTAVIHLTFNISGCLLFTPILWIFNKPILSVLEAIVSKEPMQIAVFHLFFNCTTALITTPLIDYLVKIAKTIIKDEKKEDEVIEGLINDVNNIDINPRETTNTLKDDYKGNENNIDEEKKDYEPPLSIINEKEKDNIDDKDKKENNDKNLNDIDKYKDNDKDKDENNEKKENEEEINTGKDNENIEVKEKKEEEPKNENKEDEPKNEDKKEEEKNKNVGEDKEEEKNEEEKIKDDIKIEVKNDE